MDSSPPGSSVHGISQAGILEWVAISVLPDPGIEPSSPKSGYRLYLLLIPLFVNSRKKKKKNLGDSDTKPVAFPAYSFSTFGRAGSSLLSAGFL